MEPPHLALPAGYRIEGGDGVFRTKSPARATLSGLRGCACLLVAAFSVLPAILHADWRSSLSPDTAGPFPSIRPFDAEFKIGWTDIEAGRARVRVSAEGADTLHLSASGGTSGLARMLWQLDASLDSTTSRNGFRTVYSLQKEIYAARSILTQIVSRPDGIWRLRENIPPGENPARWKQVRISPLRDLFSGMLFIRSQSLRPGDTVSTIIFPGDSPFFVEIKSLGTESITVAGTTREALKLDLRLHRINLKMDARLEPHGKFRSGTVWLSNDADRIPLRAEMDLFIGYVFAELNSVVFNNP